MMRNALGRCRWFGTAPPSLPLGIPSSCQVRLPRSVVAVYGPDASKFLNGLLTTRPPDYDDPTKVSRYAAMLNAKGRIVADTFVYQAHDHTEIHKHLKTFDGSYCYLLEIDSSLVDRVLRILDFHVLTSNVNVAPLDNYNVWFDWNDEEAAAQVLSSSISITDARAPQFGRRSLVPSEEASATSSPIGSIAEYNLRRYLLGIPEGAKELVPDKALPLDSCIDFMGGIDFDKGCYVGQELTIRTHHHGAVRKRISPIVFTRENEDVPEELYQPVDFGVESGSPIKDDSPIPDSQELSSMFADSPFGSSPFKKSGVSKRAAGNVVAALGNVGLGLIRFDKIGHAFYVDGPGEQKITVQALTPFWWPEPVAELSEEAN